MYVDATDACNTASFQLGSAPVGTSIPSRSWNLKVHELLRPFKGLCSTEVLASHPAALCSNPVSAEICSLNCLVCEQY